MSNNHTGSSNCGMWSGKYVWVNIAVVQLDIHDVEEQILAGCNKLLEQILKYFAEAAVSCYGKHIDNINRSFT